MTKPTRSQSDHKHKSRATAILTCATLAALALAACATPRGPVGQPAIPPIDLAAPQQIETATFALG